MIAGAGTGKTRAITHRIAYGVATGAYNPTSVLAVTFTTRAAGELRGRLQQLGARGVQARTFHSAALRQAQYFWPRAYGGELPAVLDNRMVAGRRGGEPAADPGRHPASCATWSPRSPGPRSATSSPRTTSALAASHHRELSPRSTRRRSRGSSPAYEQAKRDRSRIDFEDILLCAAALLSEHPEVADTIRRTYRHLVVDEYQDVSPLQEALLTLWRGDRTDLCVVGDPAQTIHSFAGAQASYLTGFARRFPGATVIRLVRDYRSTPQVVGLANAITAQAAGRYRRGDPAGPAAGRAPRSSSPRRRTRRPRRPGSPTGWPRQAAAGVAYREMAVLFRINAQSPAIEQALADRGIPYLVRGGERFYERPEVRQALLALRNRGPGPDGSTRGAEPGDAVEQVKAVLGALGWTAAAARGRRGRAGTLGVAGRAGQRGRGPAAPSADPAATALDLAVDLGRARSAGRGPARAGGPGRHRRRPCTRPRAWSGMPWRCSASTRDRCRSCSPPRPTRSDEERRLLYVGITRARRLLRISWSRTRNGGGNARKPSRFLDRGAARRAAVTDRPPGRVGTPGRGTVLSAHCRSCGQPLTRRPNARWAATPDARRPSTRRPWAGSASGAGRRPPSRSCRRTASSPTPRWSRSPRPGRGTPAELIKVQGLGPAKAEQVRRARAGDHGRRRRA